MEGENSSIPENVPELGKTPPREDIISTAIKFLQNPKVQSSPLEQKREFLIKKGLSTEEIETAIKRSGVTENSSEIIPRPAQQQNYNPVVPVQTQPVSAWNRFRDFSALAIIISGVVYAIYSLYKKFIQPYFTQFHKKQDEKLSRMEEGIAEINNEMKKNMQELQESVKVLGDQLCEQNLKMTTVSNNLAIYKAQTGTSAFSNSAFGELQAEITSVKGLLLSRKEFPSIPKNPPVIPSWQMKSLASSNASSLSEENQKEERSESSTLGSGDRAEKSKNSESEISRKDLEKDDDSEETTDELSNIHGGMIDNRLNGQPVALNGHVNGVDGVAPAINSSMLPNLTSSLLVSPTKINPISHPSNGPSQVGGEEVD